MRIMRISQLPAAAATTMLAMSIAVSDDFVVVVFVFDSLSYSRSLFISKPKEQHLRVPSRTSTGQT